MVAYQGPKEVKGSKAKAVRKAKVVGHVGGRNEKMGAVWAKKRERRVGDKEFGVSR